MSNKLDTATESNLVIGQATTDGTLAFTNSGRIKITVPAGGMTVSHIYGYGRDDTGSTTASFSIFTSGGTIVDGCDDDFDTPGDYGWFGGELTTPISLDAGEYYLQITASAAMHLGYGASYTDNAYGSSGCGTLATSTLAYRYQIQVANYAAH